MFDRIMVGIMHAIGISGWKIGIAEAVFPNFSLRLPWEYFASKKFVQQVAYEKIKLKDGKDVEIYENLDFVNYDGHSPGNPTTLKDESWWTFEEFVGRD